MCWQVRRRIHQGAFQERVLVAYGGKCAFCTLGYRELLDAAHIIPDSELRGEPVVSNGMSLCRLHHAACGVWADDFGGSAGLHHSGAGRRFGGGGWADVEAREGLQGQRIVVPSRRVDRPDVERLGERGVMGFGIDWV